MKIIIDDAAIQRALGKHRAMTAERDYIAYCDGLSGGSEKYTTVRQCAARMMGIAARRQKTLTILTIDELAGKLDALLTREEKQTK